MNPTPARIATLATVFIVLLALPAASCFAQKMHRWVDEDGQVHFSQTPPPDQGTQTSEIVSYEDDKGKNVDRACCQQLRNFATRASSYMQRGMTITEIQAQLPPSEYPYITEIINHISLDASSGDSPGAIGARAFNACMNRSFQACRADPDAGPADGGGQDSAGSGVVIGEDLVITSNHVVDACTDLAVSDTRTAGRVIARDIDADLAVIETSLEGRSPVSVSAAQNPLLGQQIVVAGYPLSQVLDSLNLTTGTVSSESGLRGMDNLFQITAPIQPGNSGGPVLDASGGLIGIVVAQLAGRANPTGYSSLPQNVNFAIAPAAVRRFLRSNGIAFRSSSGGGTLSTEAIGEQAKRHTVRVFCFR